MLLIRRKHKKRLIFLLVILVIILIVFTAIFENVLRPLQRNLIKSRANILAENYISHSVDDILSKQSIDSNKCIDIVSSDKNVKYITTNSREINKLKNKLNKALSDKLSKVHTSSIKVHTGDLTGITLLSDSGPKIKFKYNLTGSALVKLNSTLSSAGVNQTLHHITMIVTSKIYVISPSYNEEIKFSSEFEVSQTLIVGSVPSFYNN